MWSRRRESGNAAAEAPAAQLCGAQPLSRCVLELWKPSQVPCILAIVLQTELSGLKPTLTSYTEICFEPELEFSCFQRDATGCSQGLQWAVHRDFDSLLAGSGLKDRLLLKAGGFCLHLLCNEELTWV